MRIPAAMPIAAFLKSCLPALVAVAWCAASDSAAAQDAAPARGGDAPAALRVSIDFPGGSGEVEGIDATERVIRLHPTVHENRGWVCWWYVKVSGIRRGETITLDVGDAPWATPDQAMFSLDNIVWRQTATGERTGKRIRYRQQIDAEEAWFAWGPPFVPADAEMLVAWAAEKCPQAKVFELCRTREDRSVHALRLAPGADEPAPRYGIWIQARQHAWESGSSWVCRGLVEWIVSDDPRAAALRKQAEINIVPIMDLDSVAIGAGGKNQTPHDHNRDWSEDPHWPEVAAAIARIAKQNEEGRFDLFIDLHNPAAGNKNPFFFITPRELLSDLAERNLDRFLASAREDITGPLTFTGETRESGESYDQRWRYISKNWVSFHAREHVVSVTLETAWNTPHSTSDGYRTVGRQLGQAIERYFRTAPREK